MADFWILWGRVNPAAEWMPLARIIAVDRDEAVDASASVVDRFQSMQGDDSEVRLNRMKVSQAG